MALSAKLDGKNFRVCVIMCDGEVAEGSVWEAAMAGAHYKPDNSGNDIDDVDNAVKLAKKIKGKPTVIIAHTVKGCGVSFMENQLVRHHRIPSDEEYRAALKEPEERSARCE